ncbi:MAG: hypothetical protein PHU23_15315 [Dehalococcoidales bacterium]|nr:hypothetical protein [Dehalococcoidales bacterium]
MKVQATTPYIGIEKYQLEVWGGPGHIHYHDISFLTMLTSSPCPSKTTFTRQAANLGQIKESIWQFVIRYIKYDPHLSIMDSLPVPNKEFMKLK